MLHLHGALLHGEPAVCAGKGGGWETRESSLTLVPSAAATAHALLRDTLRARSLGCRLGGCATAQALGHKTLKPCARVSKCSLSRTP